MISNLKKRKEREGSALAYPIRNGKRNLKHSKENGGKKLENEENREVAAIDT